MFAASIVIFWKSCRRRSPTLTREGFWARTFSAAGSDFDIYWHGGAGAYEVGEESALMESLEGKRGIPRIRPPFPAVVGLWGGPTVINNAETLASVPHIILGGADWYAKLGPPKNGGTRLFCLSGTRQAPGVYELPMGYNLQEDDLRGWRRHSQRTRAQGGRSGRIEHAGVEVPMKSISRWILIAWPRPVPCWDRAAWSCSMTPPAW